MKGYGIGEELKGQIEAAMKDAIKKADECDMREQHEMEAYWCGVADAMMKVLTNWGYAE